MTHNILALAVYGLHWHAASGRLFNVTPTLNGYEARHVASWYVGTGSTIEAAMLDAAAGWTEDAPKAEDLWPEFNRVAA